MGRSSFGCCWAGVERGPAALPLHQPDRGSMRPVSESWAGWHPAPGCNNGVHSCAAATMPAAPAAHDEVLQLGGNLCAAAAAAAAAEVASGYLSDRPALPLKGQSGLQAGGAAAAAAAAAVHLQPSASMAEGRVLGCSLARQGRGSSSTCFLSRCAAANRWVGVVYRDDMVGGIGTAARLLFRPAGVSHAVGGLCRRCRIVHTWQGSLPGSFVSS